MKTFFIISSGRSGTVAISRFFGIEHEAPDTFYPTVAGIKERIIEHDKLNKTYWGKVSHYLASILPELKKEFPNAFFIHSVRNPRKVVASFNRVTLREPEVYAGLHKRWPKFLAMDRFRRICWMYRYWNEEAEKYVKFRVRFEDFCDYIPPMNATKRKEGEPNGVWTPEQEETFQEVCGEITRRYGYDIRQE